MRFQKYENARTNRQTEISNVNSVFGIIIVSGKIISTAVRN